MSFGRALRRGHWFPAVCLLISAAGAAEAATVATGYHHTLVVDGSGNVWSWGRNSSGQLGIGSTTPSALPVQVTSLSGIVAVAAGENHSLALGSDGRVWGWGNNGWGQVGDGTNTMRTSPVQVLTGAGKIAAGDSHSVAWKSDGTILAWGLNTSGQLGDGTTTAKNAPQTVPSFSGVASIGAGGTHTLAVKTDGTLWAFGGNGYGQLGDGFTTNRTSPVQTAGLSGIAAATGGTGHTCALTITGLVYAWGLNSSGEAGDGTTTTPRLTPLHVPDVQGVVAIAAGSHSAAVEGDGTTWCWGKGTRGQLGDGLPISSTIPIWPSAGPLGVVGIAASGGQHTAAVTSTGEVWSWGANTDGQIGDGTTGLDRLTPVKVMEAGYALKVGTPIFGVMPGTYNTTQTVALSSATAGATIRYTTDGSEPTASSTLYTAALSVTQTTTIKAKAFKSGVADSNVATGLFTLRVARPTISPGNSTYSSAQTVTISTTTSGATIRYTTDGTSPTSSSAVYSSPITVSTSGSVAAMASKAGWADSTVRLATYTFNYGTLSAPTPSPGAGTYVGSVAVTLSAGAGTSIRYTTDGSEPTATSNLFSAALTLTTTTTLKSKAFKADWTQSATTTTAYTLEVAAPTFSPGAGTYSIGQAITLSCSSAGATIYYTIDGTTPTQNDASIVSGGAIFVGNFTLKAKAWAPNMSPSAVTSATYVQSGTPAGGAAAAGATHSLVLKPDGTLWAFGANAAGQLGDTTTTQRTSPVQVTSLSSVAAIAAGASHSLALTTGGNVYAWGQNSSGQLGIGATPTSTSTPTQITSLSGVVAIAAGANHSLAVKSDGTVWAFGANASGQLGDGSTNPQNTPVQVTLSGGGNLASITSVGAGANHSLAVKSDGTAWMWGANGNGQGGIGSTSTPQTRAVQMSTLTGVTAVEGGEQHSVARKSDGTAWATGYNGYGQLGTNNFTQQTSSQEVIGLPGVTRVAAGQYFSMALASDWHVSTWGIYTALGTTSMSNSSVAVTLLSLPPIVAIAAGDTHAIVIAQDGSVWSWGVNGSGQIGDGSTQERKTPVKVADASFAWKAATPVFNVAAGTYSTTQSITITTSTSGATLYYTTDGTTPTTSSSVYSSAVSITQTTTLQAKAVKAGLADSNVTVALYTLQAANPTFNPSAGTYNANQTVTLSSTSPGVTIRYTTNGLDPTGSDPGLSSGQTVSVTQSLTLKASSWRSGWTTSAVSSAPFTMKVATPTLSPTGGVYTASQNVTIATTTSGAVIRYTTGGREPTEADPTITSGSAITLTKSATVKAKAFRAGWMASDTGSGTFVLNLGTVASPTFSPAAGTYTTAQSVTVSTTTVGSVIRYTLDGSDPTPWSPVFAAPITVAASLTVKARAYRPDQIASAVASAAYTINSGAVDAPTFSVAGGSYTTRRTVVVSCATSSATIRYTTTGADPTTSDTTITSGGSLVIDRSTILKAAAWKTGMATSPVTRRDYLITGAIAAGGTHTLVLKEDGTVWSFGTNAFGELGDGTNVTRTTPVQVSGLSGMVAIAAGTNHSLALKSDSTVWAWGRNTYGQIGDSTTGTTRWSPVQVTGITTATAIAAGEHHSLALLSGSTVKAWGNNGNGRLGNNSTADSNVPVSVSSVTTAVAVAAGADHSLTLLADGTVVGFGNNAQGQLGAATPSQSLVPMTVPNLSGVVALAAGQSFSYALRASGDAAGALWTFGAGGSGQLGDGTLVTNRKSVASGPLNVRAFAAGLTHGLAFRQDGSTAGWGTDDYGQLGDGTTISSRANPVKTLGAGELLQVAAASSYSVALRADGTVLTWGAGGAWLGLGSAGIQTLPVVIPSFSLVSNAWMKQDTDVDGLTNAAEYRLGSDPLSRDTNQDGIADGAEVGPGKSPTNPDTDGDGLTNAAELQKGTDPFIADTDRDGTTDGSDCHPLDNTQTTCGTSNPSDTTPPTITLDEPPGATPLP
jgi:alpha-tubulin suppressor-like RCC1 family protein